MRWAKAAVIWSGALAFFALSSCVAGMHPRESTRFKAAAEAPDKAALLKPLEDKVFADASRGVYKSGIDPVLLLELGAAYAELHLFARSNEVLEKAFAAYSAQEDNPVISLSEISANIGEALFTEGLGAYKLEPFEKVALHALKAVNYLLQGDKAAARVEVLRGNSREKLIQDTAEEEARKARAEFEEQAESQQRQLKKSTVNLSREFNPGLMTQRAQLSAADKALIQHLRNAHENAFADLLFALTLELNGEAMDALPVLGRAAELSGNSFARRYKSGVEKSSGRAAENFYLLAGIGYAPQKKPQLLMFPNPLTGAYNKITLSRYAAQPSPIGKIEVLDMDGKPLAVAEKLASFDALALKSYDEKMPVRVAKAMTRLVAQAVKDYYLYKEMGSWGSLLGTVMNIAIENADLRSWTLLPKEVLFAAGVFPGTAVRISVKDANGREMLSQEAPLGPGKTVAWLRVLEQRAHLRHHVFNS